MRRQLRSLSLGDCSIKFGKKGGTLRATVSKLLQMILLMRMDVGEECLLRERQCGFRQNRSCIDQCIHSEELFTTGGGLIHIMQLPHRSICCNESGKIFGLFLTRFSPSQTLWDDHKELKYSGKQPPSQHSYIL